nr:DNAse I-like superfamily protein [Tanacetum cinerariifolium]
LLCYAVAGIKFQVVSYNILAQSLATSRIFPHYPSPCLRKETRMPVILDVLKNLNADILCLQMVFDILADTLTD